MRLISFMKQNVRIPLKWKGFCSFQIMVQFIQYLVNKFTGCLLFLPQDYSVHLIYLSKLTVDVVTQREQHSPLHEMYYIICSFSYSPFHNTLIKYTHSLILTLIHCLSLVPSLSSAHAWPFYSHCTTNDERRETSQEERREGKQRGGGGERCAKAWGRNGGRRDWFIGGEERDQGRTSGWDRWLNGAESVWERERRRDEGQGCNWWETWPTPPSLHWSGSMPLSTLASPPSIHSCLHLSLHFSHSV